MGGHPRRSGVCAAVLLAQGPRGTQRRHPRQRALRVAVLLFPLGLEHASGAEGRRPGGISAAAVEPVRTSRRGRMVIDRSHGLMLRVLPREHALMKFFSATSWLHLHLSCCTDPSGGSLCAFDSLRLPNSDASACVHCFSLRPVVPLEAMSSLQCIDLTAPVNSV